MKVTFIKCDLCKMDGREARTAVAMYRDVEGEEWHVCHEHLKPVKEVDLEYQMFVLAGGGGGDRMNTPKTIYLQFRAPDGRLLDLVHDDVAWCVDQINENDAVYALVAEAERLDSPCIRFDATQRVLTRTMNENRVRDECLKLATDVLRKIWYEADDKCSRDAESTLDEINRRLAQLEEEEEGE